MIDKQKFFQKIKDNGLFTTITQKQVDTIEALFTECEKQWVTDLNQISYLLATAYHEAYNPKHSETRLTPLTEFGGEVYLKSQKYYPYFGRGLSQLTWLSNYKKETIRLGIDLVNNPDLMLDIPTAANSHVYCMSHGTYTGKKLSDYINDKKCDFLNARRIVNGKDCAEKIMSYAQKFLSSLT